MENNNAQGKGYQVNQEKNNTRLSQRWPEKLLKAIESEAKKGKISVTRWLQNTAKDRIDEARHLRTITRIKTK